MIIILVMIVEALIMMMVAEAADNDVYNDDKDNKSKASNSARSYLNLTFPLPWCWLVEGHFDRLLVVGDHNRSKC